MAKVDPSKLEVDVKDIIGARGVILEHFKAAFSRILEDLVENRSYIALGLPKKEVCSYLHNKR